VPVGILRSIQKYSRRRTANLLLNKLDVFWVNSANFDAFPDLSFQAANRFPSQLLALSTDVGCNSALRRLTIAEFGDASRTAPLATYFEERGSDKARHGYHHVYAKLIGDLGTDRPIAILEIGLGTNNPGLISSMGARGRPGASLRAFRDYCPSARVYGADIDPDILFEEERIRTARVDQTVPESFGKMCETFGRDKFDLIIDDGLHSSEANLNTLAFALKSLPPGGWIVIEDIPARSIAIWEVVARILPAAQFDCFLIQAKDPYLFVVRNGPGGDPRFPG
jgi:hypothetical protein